MLNDFDEILKGARLLPAGERNDFSRRNRYTA